MALKRRDDGLRLRAEMPVRDNAIAESGERFLQGRDGFFSLFDRAARGQCRHVFNLDVIQPKAETGARQSRPVKRLARVYFAARGNVAMAENMARVERVTRHNICDKRDERAHLRRRKGRHVSGRIMPVMVELYADRGGVHIRLPAPIRDARMPSARRLINQLHGLPVAANEIMRRDFRRRVA